VTFDLSKTGTKTDNLTKAYEDLEREIVDIKQKLQSSLREKSGGEP